MKFSRSVIAKVGVAALALAAAGTASVAQARGNVYFSVGANVVPGVAVGVSNAPVYYPPVYAQPVYPQPYYAQPAPVYYEPTYYVRPAPVFYAPPVFGATYYYGGHRYYRRGYHDGRHDGHHGHGR
jgi:hypothetical protein